MGFCTQCGNQIPNNEKNCRYCGAVNEGYVPPKVEPKPTPSERQVKPQALVGLKYAEGEVEVRSYLCSDIYTPSCKGYLTVTNKRVIFQGGSIRESSKSRDMAGWYFWYQYFLWKRY